MAGNGRTAGTQPSGLAVAALVCGIVGLFFANIVLGPLAVIFGGVSLSRSRRSGGRSGMAMAGLVLGVIDILVFVFLVSLVASRGGFHWYVGS